MRSLFVPLLLLLAAVAATGAERPNIVFILADDLGWADVGFHGGTAPTPNLDKLAKQGLELTHHYVAPVCSPTRTGLMTGRCWSRFGVTAPQAERAMPWDTVTLPRALKSLGYETALTGKWHLGSKPEWGPNHFGFDHSYGSLGGGVGPWNHFYKKGEYTNTWHRDEKLITEEGHATDLIVKEATQWIAARGDKPFFLYVPFTAVHIPIREPQPWADKAPASITGAVERHYAACIMHLDDSVGRIIAALEKAGKIENTVLVFGSDNGGIVTQNNDDKYPSDEYPTGKTAGNNKPLRGQKGELYEGGIRTPAIISWPNKIHSGKFDAPLQITDWMPTFCALTGYVPEKNLKWDGMNIWAALTGAAPLPPRQLYWAGGDFRESAIRDGDFKLIEQKARGKKEAKAELFDLAKDPYETTDLAAQMPDKVADLRAKLKIISAADRDALPEP